MSTQPLHRDDSRPAGRESSRLFAPLHGVGASEEVEQRRQDGSVQQGAARQEGPSALVDARLDEDSVVRDITVCVPMPAPRQEIAVGGRLVPLSRQESLQLLADVPLGRVVFTTKALPAIRPVNHLVRDDQIFLRSHEGASIVPGVSGPSGVVVAYEADDIDPETLTGWSVVVTGRATLVHDHETVEHCRAELTPWVSLEMDYVIRIEPEIVHGFRLEQD